MDIVTLNIGGIANVSYIPKSGCRESVLGFDTGPGMSLIDECSKIFFNNFYDENGEYAKKGKVNNNLLMKLLDYKFILKNPPKSTGRHEFGFDFIHNIISHYSNISIYDLIRTFCAYTAKSIAENLNKFINLSGSNNLLIISGGGVNHPVLISDIYKYCKRFKIIISDSIDINSDMKEALLIAVLGLSKFKGMTANMPSVTGAVKEEVLRTIIR